jgi:hypothetical protein
MLLGPSRRGLTASAQVEDLNNLSLQELAAEPFHFARGHVSRIERCRSTANAVNATPVDDGAVLHASAVEAVVAVAPSGETPAGLQALEVSAVQPFDVREGAEGGRSEVAPVIVRVGSLCAMCFAAAG